MQDIRTTVITAIAGAATGVALLLGGDKVVDVIPSTGEVVVGVEYCQQANAFEHGAKLVDTGSVPQLRDAYFLQRGKDVVEYVDYPAAPGFNSTAVLNGKDVLVTPAFVECVRGR